MLHPDFYREGSFMPFLKQLPFISQIHTEAYIPSSKPGSLSAEVQASFYILSNDNSQYREWK